MSADNEVHRSLGELHAKVDLLLEDRARLARVESKVNWFSGAATVLGTLGGAFVSYFVKTHT